MPMLSLDNFFFELLMLPWIQGSRFAKFMETYKGYFKFEKKAVGVTSSQQYYFL